MFEGKAGANPSEELSGAPLKGRLLCLPKTLDYGEKANPGQTS